jgi:phosphohistidine swiveling domain-containing protein
MKKNSKLLQSRKKNLSEDTFYRQRFDACPHFMSFIGEAHTFITNNSKYPYGQKSAYCRFSNDRADWYHSNSQLSKTADQILSIIESSKSFAGDIRVATEKKANLFYTKCLQINKKLLSEMTDSELVQEYKNLSGLYLDKLFVSSLIDGFSLVTDEIIREKIEVFLTDDDVNINEIFEKLTAHTFVSFLQQEEIDLLGVNIQIKDNPNKADELISNHQEKYFWIQNNYVDDKIVTKDFFVKRLSEFDNVNCKQKIAELQSLSNKHIDQKKRIFEELNISNEIKQIIELTDIFNYLQDERKKSTFWATHYVSLFLEELVARTGYIKDNLRYSLPSEFESVLNKEVDEDDLIERRAKGCVVLWYEDEYEVIVGQDEIEFLDSLTRVEIGNVSEVKGLVASRGMVTGPVRVVESAKDIGKVDEGDVMVSVMTRPDYLSAMKKAVAFVTDEGGVTCHAAIVARELKKPCVIATKNATKVFKDGDIVEVDADNGVVRKIDK